MDKTECDNYFGCATRLRLEFTARPRLGNGYACVLVFHSTICILDIAVLSRDADEEKVAKLKEVIKKFSEEELTFCPESLPGQNRFDVLQHDLESSQYTFLFLDEGCEEDGWMQFQQNAALMRRIGDHSRYVVPVKARSQTRVPWFLQMYHVLELSAVLKGRHIEDIEVELLTADAVNTSLIKILVNAVVSKTEKLVISFACFFVIRPIRPTAFRPNYCKSVSN